jgi:hypothetical protein
MPFFRRLEITTIGDTMKSSIRRRNPWRWEWFLIAALFLPSALNAQKNDVMGQIQFEGKSSIDKDSGVWVDGEYVGYLKELKGSKKILLLPGEHEIIVRQDGYQDFKRQVQIQPGQTEIMSVSMEKAVTPPLPTVTATVKIVVNPARAAVFVDGLYVGHVGEFKGMGRGLLVAPGSHRIKVALAGYDTFETSIKPDANQKVEVKTDLVKSSGPLAAPLVSDK